MAGLREKQKASRKRALVEAASLLFKQHGYEAAKIGEIAERAEVSVGTFYNYFPSKADLLLAIVSLEVEEVLHQGEAVLGWSHDSAPEAICRLASIYYDHSLVYLTKEMWRTAMALAIQHPETPFSDRYRMLDSELVKQVTKLVEVLQAQSLLRAEIDPAAFGEVLFMSLNGLFTTYTMSEDMTLEDLNQSLSTHMRAVCG
ncbi:TetR/AcrR family transcriptional regulator [Celeribacter sp. PS-C1]|uniref:TetR/AcrR family transcriptional regulator n=1 Tax=Celeribacter sp. PS-C1 TaxID=2820813 RepID=UPI001C66BC0F|nr:TetR/AcrR family transcriptional regulator [Celeribacter sp. PS-C1]MBW6418804.1 TetR/AcrR family transcriptional regulator [Celeribacter sp. PS-C1]